MWNEYDVGEMKSLFRRRWNFNQGIGVLGGDAEWARPIAWLNRIRHAARLACHYE
jgi:hypothetical protein